MPLYRYFLSANATDLSPPTELLSIVAADSTAAAILKLANSAELPTGWESLMVHFLVWTSADGRKRGFESMRMCDVAQLVPSVAS